MRIAYLINRYPHVSHSFIRREIHALERRGFDILRIAVRGWDGDLPDPDDRAERERTRYVLRTGPLGLAAAFARVLLTHPIRLLHAVAAAWRMSRPSERPFPVHLAYVVEACRILGWLRAANVVHVHAHFGTNSAEVAMLVHILGGPPWSFTAHGTETFDNPKLVGLTEKLSRCAAAVAVSSYGRAQMLRAAASDESSKIHLIRCGLDLAAFEASAVPDGDSRRLVCVARLSPEKGHTLLLEAARQLNEGGIAFELVLAGDGELRPEVETLIQHHKLTGKVRVTGWLDGAQVREEIRSARALVLPSLAEGLPVVLMEAMALRRPVIATSVGGIPELVQGGENGWLVPAGDAEALAGAMQTCLDESAQVIARMGAAGHARVRAQHDIDGSAAALDRLFRSSSPA